ncbi:MAG: ACT domain-containing protein [Pseudomonadota bacterium]
MSGETDLKKLLASMEPSLNEGRYAFVRAGTFEEAARHKPLMLFQEAEAVTMILLFDEADAAGLEPEFPCCWITLNVHSSLEAIGFLARIVPRLAALGMGVNPVAGYYHDHLFLPYDRAEDAMKELKAIAAQARE